MAMLLQMRMRPFVEQQPVLEDPCVGTVYAEAAEMYFNVKATLATAKFDGGLSSSKNERGRQRS